MARPFNILHTARSLRVDGVVKVMLRNLEHLDRREFRHHVCAIHDEDALVEQCRALGIEPVFLGHRGPSTAIRSVRRLRALMKEREIDLVHVNRTLDLALVGTAARLRGIPIVSSLHWLGRVRDHPEVTGTPAVAHHVEKLLPVLLNRALSDRIIAVSEAVRESFAAMPGFPVTRTEVVYPGLDMSAGTELTDVERTRLLAELGLHGADPILLNVGRLEPVKGQMHLLPMMCRVLEHMPRARLLIAGGGALHESLAQEIAARGLSAAVTLLGTRSDVDTLLALCDVLVLASESEAAPLPLFEAPRAGKPVVATAVGGVPELIRDGETGIVVPRGDPDAMADAVLRMCGTPGRAARMGAAARARARRDFDIRTSTQALERIYRSLLRSRSPVTSAADSPRPSAADGDDAVGVAGVAAAGKSDGLERGAG